MSAPEISIENQQAGDAGVPLNILVVGATGGSGLATVRALLDQGHRVTAFARGVSRLQGLSSNLVTVAGDVMNREDIERAMVGQNAVIVTLGIGENPLRVRLFGASGTAPNVRSVGTRNVIDAMRRHGVRRLVVQSSFGVGDTRSLLRRIDRLLFALLLQPQIDDTEVQEQAVRGSGLDWTLARPVHLTDDEAPPKPFLSEQGRTRLMRVARKAVAAFLAGAVVDQAEYVGKSVAVSG